ncbi:glycosyltransferase family 25 protein [Tabrizicola sp. YIM 78059]|uniref:glycosyltransferase family 25 protein n=1 Tax=Tabrizicola sp. YIM 78059 TaxID=2529861 RepID=UPI0020BDD780|nr:glycosyltransferase family 25 protein [Tabrizicola sp. YIM 78059]
MSLGPLTRADIGIWLINLPRDIDRRARMEAQLAALGLNHTLFPAIDGRAEEARLMQRADAGAYARNMGAPLLPGKLGVYASHLAVWDALIASPNRAALILEDDVVFHEDFLEALDTALAHADLWDLVRFNCIRAKLPVTQARLGCYRLNAYVGPFTGNACYLIHRDVAARLAPRLWPQTRALDHELNRFFLHDYRQLGLEPWASHPDDGGTSTITGTGFALVKKPHWTSRLPHYRLKAANYLRRAFWLLKRGMLFPKRNVS